MIRHIQKDVLLGIGSPRLGGNSVMQPQDSADRLRILAFQRGPSPCWLFEVPITGSWSHLALAGTVPVSSTSPKSRLREQFGSGWDPTRPKGRLWVSLPSIYLLLYLSEGFLEVPGLPEPCSGNLGLAGQPVPATQVWPPEFSDFCGKIRPLRIFQYF